MFLGVVGRHNLIVTTPDVSRAMVLENLSPLLLSFSG